MFGMRRITPDMDEAHAQEIVAAFALTRYFGKRAGEPLESDEAIKRRGIEARQRSTPPFVETVQLELIREFDRTRSPEAVCDRLQSHIVDLERGDVAPAQLAIRNRVSKPLAEYAQETTNVAALQRAADLGLETHPGEDVQYVVVDDKKRGRDRVCLLYENPESYDVAFYTDQLVRAAESVLSPLGWCDVDIRRYLADRVDASIRSFG